jgi:hypothetical protein
VARYGQAFKDRVVARLLPPESASLDEVSLEVGVGAQTLQRWLSDALVLLRALYSALVMWAAIWASDEKSRRRSQFITLVA